MKILKLEGVRGPRYQLRYRTIDKRQVKETFGRYSEAQARMREIEGYRHKGISIDPAAGRETFGDYSSRWLESRPLRPRSKEEYRSLLGRYLTPHFGTISLAAITPKLCREWHEGMIKNLGKVPRVAKAYRLLRVILNTAVIDDILARNPCIIPEAGKEDSPERPLVTVETALALADAMPTNRRPLVLLAAFCGLRMGELQGLRRRHFDLENRIVSIEGQIQQVAKKRYGNEFWQGPPKSRAGLRQVIIPSAIASEIAEHLLKYAAPGDDGFVFYSKTREGNLGPLRRRWLYAQWAEARRRVGVEEDLRIHDLRHLQGTLVAQLGATTKELMARLGHSTPRAALIYQHASKERERDLTERMDSVIRKASEGQSS